MKMTCAKTHGSPRPLITVITPCLNSVETMTDNLVSVQAAREALVRGGWDLEHLIVDGGSLDGTAQLVARHAANHSYCRLTSDIGGGPYAAMNAGLRQATGRYIHVLNSDDLLLDPEAYVRFILEGHGNGAKVLIASIGYFCRPARHLKSLWLVDSIPADRGKWRQQLLRGLHYPHPGFIADSEVYRAQAFDERYSLSADYKLMQAILLRQAINESAMACSQPLVAMAEGGATGNWKAMLKGWRQLADINQELGIQTSSLRRYWSKLKQRLQPLPQPIIIQVLESPET